MKTACYAMLSASLFVAGCAATPPADILPDFNPANAATGLRDARYRPVVNYVHREPVDPKNWRRLNDELAPSTGDES
jgi:hypothetical protein